MPEETLADKKITPKSILRHRPIGRDTTIVSIARRASRLSPQAFVGKEPKGTGGTRKGKVSLAGPSGGRSPSGPSKRPKGPSPLAQAPAYLTKPHRARHNSSFRPHPLLLLGLGMMAMLLLWIVLSAAWNWGTITWDDLHYGRPRTYQVDAWVGHNEQTGHPSHFIVLNLNRRIEIIEIAGGDPAHTRIYPGPQLYKAQSELIPVTVRFTTSHGKKYPNMTVLFGDSQVIYLNENGTFVLQ